MAFFDFRSSDSKKLAAEIAREQEHADAATRALAEAESSVQQKRDDAILAGDEKSVHRIDAELAARLAELRVKAEIHSKRVTLLHQKRDEAEASEERARIDAIASRAERARAIGVDLLKKTYAKQAEALAGTLAQLRAIDQFIETQNRSLEQAGRDRVASPNEARTIQGFRGTRRKTIRVGLSDPRHPDHAEYWAGRTQVFANERDAERTHETTLSGKQVPKIAEIEIDENVSESNTWAHPVYKEITKLPGVMADAPQLFSHYVHSYDSGPGQTAWEENESIVAKLGV